MEETVKLVKKKFFKKEIYKYFSFFFLKGANVSIKNSYLWDGVTVEDNVIIDRAILCNNVTILKNSRVQEGSILSFDVKLYNDFCLPLF